MNLSRLRTLLDSKHPSSETIRAVAAETVALFREDTPNRWFYLLLNRVFVAAFDNPEMHDFDRSGPALAMVFEQSRAGVDAIERNDMEQLIQASNLLTEAFCGLP